ncbi:MAG: helix-turn-helix transcriptional regulator [Acidobacteria bacterium]|nr:helix-turn-helix transcriptional regulator [Acidobacteriota bacterium]
MRHPDIRLSTTELDTLVALTRGQRHALAIVYDRRERYGRRLVTEPQIYRALRRLRGLGLVVECEEAIHDEEDVHRRAQRYRVTPEGQRVARAESERLSLLLTDCRAAGF